MKRYFFGVLASGALVVAMMGMVYMYYKYPITLLIPVIAYTWMYLDVRHSPVQDSR